MIPLSLSFFLLMVFVVQAYVAAVAVVVWCVVVRWFVNVPASVRHQEGGSYLVEEPRFEASRRDALKWVK